MFNKIVPEATFERETQTKTGYWITCNRCKYKWLSESKSKRICCSKCRTSITVPLEVREQTAESFVSLVREVALPLDLVKTPAFIRAIAWAKTNGEDGITLKTNKEGILYLPTKENP